MAFGAGGPGTPPPPRGGAGAGRRIWWGRRRTREWVGWFGPGWVRENRALLSWSWSAACGPWHANLAGFFRLMSQSRGPVLASLGAGTESKRTGSSGSESSVDGLGVDSGLGGVCVALARPKSGRSCFGCGEDPEPLSSSTTLGLVAH